MDLFKTEEELFIALDHFVCQSKGLNTSKLRNRLIGKIYEFLRENELDTDQHNFVDLSKIKRSLL